MRLGRYTMPLLATLCGFALLVGACGGSDSDSSSPRDGNGSSETNADQTDDDGAPDGTDASSDGDSTDPGDVDCATLKTNAELVGLAIQIYPQMQSADTLSDTFVLPDLGALQAAIDSLRPIANDETDAFLDDIAAGAEIIASGRAGDADAAVADLAEITGGLDGLQDWLLRQIALGDSLRATGCENLG